VPAENLHLTLRFVGEVAPNQAEDIDLALAALRGRRLTLEMSGVGTVNRAGREVALWAGIARNPALEHLQAKIETALQRAGMPPEKRRFTLWKPSSRPICKPTTCSATVRSRSIT
jgi:2'-5' RNA ligase